MVDQKSILINNNE